MQFDSLTSNMVSLVKFWGKNYRSRPFERQFWPILTVFVILSMAQSPRWASHLIIAKNGLFASFSCINHLFLSISLPTMTICIERFLSAMHSGSVGGYKYPKLLVTCNGCDHDKSAPLGRSYKEPFWSCQPDLCHVLMSEDRSASSLSYSCLGKLPR